MPDGATIVQEFAPEYPEQLRDISYGAGGAMAIPDSLVGAGAGATILVPSDGSLGTQVDRRPSRLTIVAGRPVRSVSATKRVHKAVPIC